MHLACVRIYDVFIYTYFPTYKITYDYKIFTIVEIYETFMLSIILPLRNNHWEQFDTQILFWSLTTAVQGMFYYFVFFRTMTEHIHGEDMSTCVPRFLSSGGCYFFNFTTKWMEISCLPCYVSIYITKLRASILALCLQMLKYLLSGHSRNVCQPPV